MLAIKRTRGYVSGIGIRQISISQPPSVTIPSTVGLGTHNNLHIEEVPTRKLSAEVPELHTLGSPPTILSVDLPASVPFHIRKGSLLSIYGIAESGKISLSSIRNQLEWISPVKRLFYGNFASSYQTLVSTIPFSVLVSSNRQSRGILGSKSSFGKSFAILALDGRQDWALFPNDALQAYSGSTLNITNPLLPRRISRGVADELNISRKTSTGLSRWYKMGYTLLSGRGYVGIVGNGQIYRLELSAGEELLVNKRNLLSLSINGTRDLESCVVQESLGSKQETESVEQTQAIIINEDERVPDSVFTKAWRLIKTSSEWVSHLLGRAQTISFDFVTGNTDYVKIIGPRSLLLQTNVADLRYSTSMSSGNTSSGVSQAESLIQTQIETETIKRPVDYLSYATVDNGKVVFKSTPDFKETVDHIESLKKS